MILKNISFLLKEILVVYCLFGLLLFFSQKSMIYYPNNQDFKNCEGFSEYEKVNFQGTRFYYKERSLNSVLVYYHGNAGSACDRSILKPYFEETGVSIIFVEYAGYSNDNKKPSKDLLLQDARNMNKYLEDKGFEKIIIYGESIGSGVGSYHASIGKVDSLIFVGSFSSLEDVARSKLPIFPMSVLFKENYDNVKWLQEFKGKIIILHGENDEVIPLKFSQRLFEKISTEKKEHIIIEGRGHNDIWGSSYFRDKIIDFINNAE